ncbi:hypothetical protein EG328_009868 [Venturia inaequalis]|uniref:Uncharacterized protein n=1 Tax=Venturia inaequalis TaxID=5025 RepID=A0A8H3Z530_VENIN|nr:hypothetical protein EG328_009868 [Venturia inaequalis]
MQLQTSLLLPAILFAQSSLAYFCCYVIVTNGANTWKSTMIDSGWIADAKGNTDYWTPTPDCKIEITKKGTGCANWSSRIVDTTCKSLQPVGHMGVAPEWRCRQ